MRVFITNTTSQPKLIPIHSGKHLLAHKTEEMSVTRSELMLLHKTLGFSVKEINDTCQSTTRDFSFEELSKSVKDLESDIRIDSIEQKLDTVMDLLSRINSKIDALEGVSVKQFTASELLNRGVNPQESRRALFQKIIEQNKALR